MHETILCDSGRLTESSPALSPWKQLAASGAFVDTLKKFCCLNKLIHSLIWPDIFVLCLATSFVDFDFITVARMLKIFTVLLYL